MVDVERGNAGMDGVPVRTELGPISGLDLQARYNSGRMGGDFYDAVMVGSRVAFLLSDIAGRRAETHPIAAETQRAFRAGAAEYFGAMDANLMDGTAMLVQSINLALLRAAGGVRFAPTFVGCYDTQLGLLAYINAGGQTAVLQDSEGTRNLSNVSMPMGLFSHLTYEPSMMALEPGAKMLVVTKGVTDCRSGQTQYGAARVLELVKESGGDGAEMLCQKVLEQARGFSKVPWYSRWRRETTLLEKADDLTAVAVVRRV
jgi:serine phosphatase RsbU (regulator of sigma subunit)